MLGNYLSFTESRYLGKSRPRMKIILFGLQWQSDNKSPAHPPRGLIVSNAVYFAPSQQHGLPLTKVFELVVFHPYCSSDWRIEADLLLNKTSTDVMNSRTITSDKMINPIRYAVLNLCKFWHNSKRNMTWNRGRLLTPPFVSS